MLRVGVASLNKLLTELMDQARLEAGHERRFITHFDVAAMLKEFCDSTRPLAAQKNLFLVAKGPPSLMVDGDSLKIQRIVQNLVLNAIKATERGGIKVVWEEGEMNAGHSGRSAFRTLGLDSDAAPPHLLNAS